MLPGMSGVGNSGGASRRDPEGSRGSRSSGCSPSIRSVVRAAQRVIRKEEWGSFTISSLPGGGVAVQVTRAQPTASPSTRPNSAGTSAAPGKVQHQQVSRMNRKERKQLQCKRYTCLTRCVSGGYKALFARRVVRLAFRAIVFAGSKPIGVNPLSDDTPATAPIDADPAVGPPGQEPAAKPSTPASPMRSSPPKRSHSSPGKGKKSGRRA